MTCPSSTAGYTVRATTLTPSSYTRDVTAQVAPAHTSTISLLPRALTIRGSLRGWRQRVDTTIYYNTNVLPAGRVLPGGMHSRASPLCCATLFPSPAALTGDGTTPRGSLQHI